MKKKINKPHYRRIDVDVFKDALHLVWPVNRSTAENICSKMGWSMEIGDLKELEVSDGLAIRGSFGSIIFLREWNNTPHFIGVLAHECVHVAADILSDKGISEVAGKEEAMAYLVDYLVCTAISELYDKKGCTVT
jgi:hypothetical protein